MVSSTTRLMEARQRALKSRSLQVQRQRDSKRLQQERLRLREPQYTTVIQPPLQPTPQQLSLIHI